MQVKECEHSYLLVDLEEGIHPRQHFHFRGKDRLTFEGKHLIEINDMVLKHKYDFSKTFEEKDKLAQVKRRGKKLNSDKIRDKLAKAIIEFTRNHMVKMNASLKLT